MAATPGFAASPQKKYSKVGFDPWISVLGKGGHDIISHVSRAQVDMDTNTYYSAYVRNSWGKPRVTEMCIYIAILKKIGTQVDANCFNYRQIDDAFRLGRENQKKMKKKPSRLHGS